MSATPRERVLRAALLRAVMAVDDLGGCLDPECREELCWLRGMDGREPSVRDLMTARFVIDGTREVGG